MLSRRRLLQIGGLAAASAVGCGRVEKALFEPLWHSAAGPFVVPSSDHKDLARHLLDRLTFGCRPEDYASLLSLAPGPGQAVESWLEAQLDPGSLDDRPVERLVRRLETLDEPAGELFEYQPDLLRRELTSGILLRAIYSTRQVQERVVHFWTDHFNIDSSKGDCKWLAGADHRDVIRAHALDNFPALLRAVVLSPSMLWYLDGRQNRADRGRPNENYARELLELHTLGVDSGYSQRDVMEAARALSGWTVRSDQAFGKGRVEFHGERHDDGPKQVLGRTIPAGLGAKDLDALLDIVALHPATARHLAFKLCRRFIADEPPISAVQRVAEAYLSTSGDISSMLRTLFLSPELHGARENKLKRPLHFVVSALRALGAETDAGKAVAGYLLSMGHAPYQYPTPDGYPDVATPWVGTLLWRWSFSAALVGNRIPGTRVELEPWLSKFDGRHQVAGQRVAGQKVASQKVAGQGVASQKVIRQKAAAHILGRRPNAQEQPLLGLPKGRGLALLLSSPTFQYC